MGKSPLVAVTLALLSGLFFSEAFSFFPLTLSLFVLSLLFLEAFFFQTRLISYPVFFIWAAGFLLHQAVSVPYATNDLSRYIDKEEPVKIVAVVSAPPAHASTHISLKMEAISITDDRLHPVKGVFQLYISGQENPFKYGDRLEMRVRLRRPKQYYNSGSFLYADYRERIGWDGVASLSHFRQARKLGEGGNPVLKRIYRWREMIREKIQTSVDDPEAAILMAMIIGESGYLTEAVREDFIAAGIAHLLAVSGTHLAFVSFLIFTVVRWLLLRFPEPVLLRITIWKIPSQWAAMVTAVAVTFYAFLAGGRIGTLRALTMILVYLISIWIGRSRDTKISLSLAALLIIFFNPQAIFEISFQLSFTAVLSIILFMEWWKETETTQDVNVPTGSIKTMLIRSLRLLFLSSMSAAIGTTPLTLFYFQQFSWVGLISSLVLLPLAGWVLIPIALASAVGSLFLGQGFLFPGVHVQLWSHFYALIRVFASLPGADFHFASPPLFLLLLFYGALFFGLVTRKSRKWLFSLTVVFFTIFLGWGGVRISPEKLRVTFLDVGQGDAILIEFPHGKTMLIDGGTKRAGRFSVAPYLWQRRIRTIDYLVGTHPQFDHIGGLPYIIRKFNVKTVWSNGFINKTKTYQSFQKAIRSAGATDYPMTRDNAPVMIDGCRFSFLNPLKSQILRLDNLNNQSLAFRMTCSLDRKKPVSLLFTGDIERAGEARLIRDGAVLQSTILKVPHHGSRSSSTEAFIAAVSPEIALFSVGRKNRYRHPHPEVVATYKALGIEIYRTDQKGAIVVEAGGPSIEGTATPGNSLSVSTYLDQKRRRIRWSGNILKQEWTNLKKVFL